MLMKKQKKIIGLIGGMGPFASSYFYRLLLEKGGDIYGAKNNDDFPEILIDSVPVPDFISDTKKLKVAEKMLISCVKKMNGYGVGVIAMVCNTGHLLYKKLSSVSRANFLSMVDLVAEEASKRGYERVGVLATPTTVKFDLYGKALFKKGVKVFYPNRKTQELHKLIIRSGVEGKKTLNNVVLLENSTKKFIKEDRLDGVILGCTELSLIYPKDSYRNVIDCMDVLADELLVRYYK